MVKNTDGTENPGVWIGLGGVLVAGGKFCLDLLRGREARIAALEQKIDAQAARIDVLEAALAAAQHDRDKDSLSFRSALAAKDVQIDLLMRKCTDCEYRQHAIKAVEK